MTDPRVASTAEGRVVCRFSCGAASAVMTKLVLAKNDRGNVIIENSAMGGEDADNRRFLADCEVWFGHPINVRQNDKYSDHIDVWEKERFIKGQGGTACRARMKDDPWQGWREPTDILAIGYTIEEQGRADSIRKLLGDSMITPLIDAGLTKEDCFGILVNAGIELPRMYRLGFKNANCIGCCHGGMGYWNKIRDVFPDYFARAARAQRDIGTDARFWIDKAGEPIMLDQLEPGRGHYPSEPSMSCSIMCHIAEQDIAS